jgi:hypothetical protein
MGAINTRRVLTGGLAAGLVVNVVEFLVNSLWVGRAWTAALAGIGVTVRPGLAGAAPMVLWAFLVGITAVWIYAAVRPRFGAGPATAVRAGLATWVLGYLSGAIAAVPLGLFPVWLLGASTLVGLPEIIVATLAGASIYREEASA